MFYLGRSGGDVLLEGGLGGVLYDLGQKGDVGGELVQTVTGQDVQLVHRGLDMTPTPRVERLYLNENIHDCNYFWLSEGSPISTDVRPGPGRAKILSQF